MKSEKTIHDFEGNEPALNAYILIMAGYSLYLSGHMSTGKSTLVKIILKEKNKHETKAVALTTTRLYAKDVDGDTIYSFLNFKRETISADNIQIDSAALEEDIANSIEKIDLIILYQVSTISGKEIDIIDARLRKIRNNNLPYGGIQMVFVGDHFVYKPFHKYRENKFGKKIVVPTGYFFDSTAFIKYPPIYICLKICYGNIDRTILEFMTALRQQENTLEYFIKLKKIIQGNKKKKIPFRVQLKKRKNDANIINEAFINNLVSTNAKDNKDRKDIEINTKNLLNLCDYTDGLTIPGGYSYTGTQVIFTEGDPNGKYKKGDIGIFSKQKWFKTFVELSSKELLQIKSISGNNKRSYLPLRICWAMNIYQSHRIQLAHIEYELEGKWEERGVVHCALTRCTSINSLIFTRPINENDAKADESIFCFDKKIQGEGELRRLKDALAEINNTQNH